MNLFATVNSSNVPGSYPPPRLFPHHSPAASNLPPLRIESKGSSNFGKVLAGRTSDKELLRQSAADLVSYCGERFQRGGFRKYITRRFERRLSLSQADQRISEYAISGTNINSTGRLICQMHNQRLSEHEIAAIFSRRSVR
ncbi:uncharacterized protein LOC141837197 [Curcuma longa]|uniref:uncharacterized protein LOC141837197 n=1 Tax=Curcuma longa TaxID=136217 RepID=UPI003D9DCBE6